MWDLPRSGMEAVSSALAGGFFTTEPLGKPQIVVFNLLKNYLEINIKIHSVKLKMIWS